MYIRLYLHDVHSALRSNVRCVTCVLFCLCARVHVLVSVEPPSISDHTAAISLNSLYLANRVLVTRFCFLCSTEWHYTQLLDVIVASWKFYILIVSFSRNFSSVALSFITTETKHSSNARRTVARCEVKSHWILPSGIHI